MRHALFLLGLVFLAACSPKRPPESAEVWKKIKFNFKDIGTDGLASTPGGSIAVNYEFCIPADNKKWRAVRKIDPTAQRNGGKGRVGCREDQWLVIGSTQQKNWQRTLYKLAALPYIARIEEVFWE